MDQQRNADVVVPILCADHAIVGHIRRVLDLSGPTLRRLLLVDDGRLDAGLEGALAELAADPRLLRIHGFGERSWSGLCNLGLSARLGDAVLLTTETSVTEGWLVDLAEAVHSEERAALAAPAEIALDLRTNEENDIRRAVAGLPRWTATKRVGRGCNYLRGEMIDAVGLLDPTFVTPSAALDDWLMRATALGFFARRANRSFVFAGREDDPDSAEATADRDALQARHPLYAAQLERVDRTLDASLTRHAVELQRAGKLRVALDLRHMPMEHNGTRMYALSLGKALAALPEIDLTLIAAHPIQAEGVPGRIVSPDQWADDVAVIHKPAQFFDQRHAKLLFESRAHVFVTYQDLIAYRMPEVFTNESDYNTYRSTSRLTLQAAQGILAYSRCTAREIAGEFSLPIDDVSPILLGVDVDAFGTSVAEAERIKIHLNLPSRYFLSLASDYPHKNINSLLEAYEHLRRGWRDGEPPSLVLAGKAPSLAAGLNKRPGVLYVGVVSADELKVLYQTAEALVFPSLYEGFGLPPLEAMAAGTAVVAMPFSSVPEVCGDAVLYSDGLTPVDLSRAMWRMATDPDLKADLIASGRCRIETLRWQNTARETYEAYCKAVLYPSDRSLRMRRFLNEAIIRWSQPPVVEIVGPPPPENDAVSNDLGVDDTVPVVAEPEPEFVAPQPPPMGVINACCALRDALGRRVRRDLGHLKSTQRLRLFRAGRLSRRAIEVVRTDGLAEAYRKARRKLAHAMRPTGRRTSGGAGSRA